MGRKHCGKRRNCSLRAISPFPTVFSKRLVSQGRQKVSLCGNGLSEIDCVICKCFNPLPHNHELKLPCKRSILKTLLEKRENAGNQYFLLFPQLYQTGIIILTTKNLSSSNAFNLVKAKMLSFI